MKQIDTGGLSFQDIRKKDKYYVDKSLLIKDILDCNDSGVYLFTRPRRFGKTTNLSMLDAFFNMQYKGNDWFDDLEISKYPEYGEYKNAFPVIHLDLKSLKASDFDAFLNKMRGVMRGAYLSCKYILESEDIAEDVGYFFRTLEDWSIPKEPLEQSLEVLSSALERYHDRKVIILIDEYDRAVSDAYGSESHRPMMDFLGDFLCAALKNNDSLQMACVTGIMQIAEESIFSGLNNIWVDNIFSTESDERFGFTEEEVKQILSDFGHPEKFEEVKQWYDGYRFGNAEVYNPFSVMNYVLRKFKPESYWVNSGSGWVMESLLKKTDDSNMSDISDLVIGGSVKTRLSDRLVYGRLDTSDETLYSLMAMAGYLKAVPLGNRMFEVSIPNEEVREEVGNILEKMVPINTSVFSDFAEAFLGGDAEMMEKTLGKFLGSSSYMNLRDENAYEMVLMTLLYALSEKYTVKTEREGGNGRIDILLTPKIPGNPNIIVELKRTDGEKELGPALDAAMCQMHERKYYLGMSGRVILTAMAFWGKIPKVRTEILEI